MANRIQQIIFRYTDAAGAPLAGGKVYFYESGTSTPKDTYADEDKAVTNANPVILNARGEADIFLSGAYKVVVYDSNDNLIETQDNVYEHPDIVDVGDPGTESSGINVNGVTYKARLRVNDIGGAYAAQHIIHRHSTSLQPLLLFARSNTDDTTHSAVTSGQALSSIFAAGWTGTHYDLFGESNFSVGTGTVSATSSPGKWSLKLTPDSSNTPVDVIVADSDKSVSLAGSLTVAGASNYSTITSGTVTATTSGTSHEYTGIPSWVKKVTISIGGISGSGTSPYIIQIGDASAYKTASYYGTSGYVTAAAQGASLMTSGFQFVSAVAAGTTIHGIAVLSLINSSTNEWGFAFTGGQSDTAAVIFGGGTVLLTSALTRLKLTTIGGTDTFDAGSFNIMYE